MASWPTSCAAKMLLKKPLAAKIFMGKILRPPTPVPSAPLTYLFCVLFGVDRFVFSGCGCSLLQRFPELPKPPWLILQRARELGVSTSPPAVGWGGDLNIQPPGLKAGLTWRYRLNSPQDPGNVQVLGSCPPVPLYPSSPVSHGSTPLPRNPDLGSLGSFFLLSSLLENCSRFFNILQVRLGAMPSF